MADSEPIVQVVEGDIDPSSIARQVYALIGLSSQERKERLATLQRQNFALHDQVASRLADALRLRQTLAQLSDDATQVNKPTGVSNELVRIDGYFCLEKISLGGQGDVYLANQISTGQLVAIKVLRPAENKAKLSLRRFEREVDALAVLNHPGIVQIIDRGTTDDEQPYVATKFIEGLHLDEYVEGWREEHVDQSPLAESVLQIWFQIADGLSEIHKAGLIHRDIKPSNIIVSDNGQPLILDFGLAKNLLPDNITSLDVTTRATFIGTPKWASPEQATLGGRNVDARSDVYSLGLLLYYMISGRMPYDVSGNMQQILAAIATQEPVPLRQACRPKNDTRSIIAGWLNINKPSVSPSHKLEIVLHKALAKSPDQRYQSVEDFVNDVKRCLAGKSPLHVTAHRQIPRRVGLGFGLIAVCIASAGLAGWLPGPFRVPQRITTEEGVTTSGALKSIRIPSNRTKPGFLDESIPPEKRYLKKMTGARFFRGHSYFLLRGRWSWEEANQYAQLVGGHLFVPDDHKNERAFLSDQIHHMGVFVQSRPYYWIGLKHSKSTGTMTWDNKPIAFNDWRLATDLGKEEMQHGFGYHMGYGLTTTVDFGHAMLIEWPFIPAREDIGNGVPPKDAVIRGDYAYKLYTDPQSYILAIDACFKRGGCLVDIQSEEEEEFLVNLVAEKELLDVGAWIGAQLYQGQLDLVTGHPATYANVSDSADISNILRAHYFYLSEEGWLAWKGDSTDALARPYICKWVLKK